MFQNESCGSDFKRFNVFGSSSDGGEESLKYITDQNTENSEDVNVAKVAWDRDPTESWLITKVTDMRVDSQL